MIKEYLLENIKIDDFKKGGQDHFFVSNSDDYNKIIIYNDFLKNNKTIFVVLPNLYQAQKYYDSFCNLTDFSPKILFYPSDQTLTTMMAISSPEFKSERLFTLRKLLTEENYIVITTYDAVTTRQLSKNDYQNSVLKLKKGETYDIDKLIKLLVNNGYERVFTVEKPQEYSVRGSIIDIYSLNYQNPFRLDFFGDTLDSIREFDCNSQRSISKCDEYELIPSRELFYTEKMKEEALFGIENFFSKEVLSVKEQEKLTSDLEKIANRKQLDSLLIYTDFFCPEKTTVLDFKDNKEVYLIEQKKMILNEKSQKDDLIAYSNIMGGGAFLKIPFKMNLDYLSQYNPIIFEREEKSLIRETYEYKGNLNLFIYDISLLKDYTVIIFIKDLKNYDKLKDLLVRSNLLFSENRILKNQINLLNEGFYLSFLSARDKQAIFNESTIFNIKQIGKIRYRNVLNQSTKVRNLGELRVFDYVVHYDYGIGRYIGLKTMEIGGNKRDYLVLEYADNEILYVPADQLDLILKYSSYEGISPKLSSMRGKVWSKTKANVKKKIKELSDRLLRLYSKREQAEGFIFLPDDEFQQEMESDFGYDETIDQRKAILEVKNDMESKTPMDRLICGDVGFGKTEVALRAAFKAVLSLKQVVYLVPTTVLARQHYYTFKDRLEKYGCNISLLSRFIGKKEERDTLKGLEKGMVDIVIGTHRLLSDDVRFKDLGLFIVDEEQRFGVLHKERIKEIKANVDSLTLTATPIPRTMQMSLLGLKDISLINTPPRNRYPVQTYVMAYEKIIVKEAIEREMARGGQVFYLFNNVSRIASITTKLRELVTGARITFIHGQMPKNKIEEVISDFIDHEYDCLVATTIIETGIDIPNANTLIIHEADKLGLSQLYQIRGRVGRSDKIAYAYLLYDSKKDINDEAQKRLKAIENFTELGSGYKIAMRDLAIRGAGDILGSEQSGFIDSVGIELYMKLLNDALLNNEEEIVRSEVIDDIYAKRHIDEEYINDDTVRVEIHKRISHLNQIADINNLKEELIDRFGQLSPDLILYMYEKLYKKLSNKLGVKKTIVQKTFITLVLGIDESLKVDGAKLFFLAEKSANIKLGYIKAKVEITFDISKDVNHWLVIVSKFLNSYFYN